MKKYKLTTQKITTHLGHPWEIGVKQTIETPGVRLCTTDVFHFYDSPELAILLNPIHANIPNPRLWEVACNQVAHDGLKGGAKWMTLKKELPLPAISATQKVAFGIYCARDIAKYSDPSWLAWADKWLSGADRSAASAARVADAASAASAARATSAARVAGAVWEARAAGAASAASATSEAWEADAVWAARAAGAARAASAADAAELSLLFIEAAKKAMEVKP